MAGAGSSSSTAEPWPPLDESAELERIAAVRRYEILDTPPDGAFDAIAAVAARTFGVPIGIVSIVDSDRIWFKSHHGLPAVVEVGRDPGLCASAILQDEPWIVTDASVDVRTLANPLVAGEMGLRFYAGVPLTTVDGFNLGTLCVLDTEPRAVTADELRTLQHLAGVVVQELELRRSSLSAVRLESQLRREAERLSEALQASLLPPSPPAIPGLELATRYLPGEKHLEIGGDFYDVFRLAGDQWGIVVGDACGKGPRAASVAALGRWSVRASAVHHIEPSAVLSDLNTVLWEEGGEEDDRFCSVVFARLELAGGAARVALSSAGHPLPIVVRAVGQVEDRGGPGLPVGMFDAISTVDDHVDLGPGDSIVFYTDGITEARDAHGELFGEDRLRDVVAAAGTSADAMATALVDAARAFGAGLRDDVAVVVVRVPDDGRQLAAPGPGAAGSARDGVPHAP